MAQPTFKIVISTSRKELFTFLQKKLLYQNIELFYLPNAEEIEQFISRIQPHIIIASIGSQPLIYKKMLRVLEKLRQANDTWCFLLVENEALTEKIIPALPDNRYFLFNYDSDYTKIAYNVKVVKDIFNQVYRLEAEKDFQEHFNYCLKIIHQERQLNKLFERLINYFPKIINMDYWAIFNMDVQLQAVQNFTQFIPPTRRSASHNNTNLEKMAESWLKRGRTFSLSLKEDRSLFKKLSDWGWPVKKIYFFPASLKDRQMGGVIIGSVDDKDMQARDIRFLTDMCKLTAERIIEVHSIQMGQAPEDDFANQLIVKRFSEDSIFYLSCKKLNQITHASSTVFWQYNKGFGFIFPKYFYFKEGEGGWQSLERNVIFMKNDQYFTQLFSQDEVKSFENILSDTRFDDSTRKTFQQLKYNNLLVIPLRLQNEITGTIIINKENGADKFNIWEVQKIEEVVQQIQKVLEDTAIVKEAQLKLKQLSRIFELGNEIKLDINLDEILRRIAGNLRKALGWNDIAILVLEEYHKSLKPNTVIGFSKKIQVNLNLKSNTPLGTFDKFLGNCTRISGSYFYDSQPLKTKKEHEEIFAETITSWNDNDLLIVPMETRNKVLGYMVLHDPVDRLKPTHDRVIPLEYYANQAAIAVENLQLYDKLLASEERYRSLAETMSLGLVTCNEKSEILYINPAFEKLVGLDAKSILSHQLKNFFSHDSAHRLSEIAERLHSEKTDEKTHIENIEVNLISTTGETIPVSVFAFPYFQQRKKIGFFMVLNDLRVIKRLERMKADFNSMIVHDLRSPMNVIQGFIELIRNRVVGPVNQEQEELLDIAKENVKKVLTLVDNFLVASKIEVGKFSIDPKLNEINLLIERVVENHKILLKNKNIEMTLNLDSNLPLLFFDSLRIEQVLNNLLSNAMKFTPENGKITVNSKLTQKQLKGEDKFFASISVEDNGIGIPQERLSKIFEIYEQVENNGKLNAKGTGLGLAICREIVHLHGGEIWVESAPKKGSTFFFTLPIEPSIEKIIK